MRPALRCERVLGLYHVRSGLTPILRRGLTNSILNSTGLPNVIPTLVEKNTAVSVVLYWTPQVIGGTGFIVASVLLMLEEQKSWWRIAPLRIGWSVWLLHVLLSVAHQLITPLHVGKSPSGT